MQNLGILDTIKGHRLDFQAPPYNPSNGWAAVIFVIIAILLWNQAPDDPQSKTRAAAKEVPGHMPPPTHWVARGGRAYQVPN